MEIFKLPLRFWLRVDDLKACFGSLRTAFQAHLMASSMAGEEVLISSRFDLRSKSKECTVDEKAQFGLARAQYSIGKKRDKNVEEFAELTVENVEEVVACCTTEKQGKAHNEKEDVTIVRLINDLLRGEISKMSKTSSSHIVNPDENNLSNSEPKQGTGVGENQTAIELKSFPSYLCGTPVQTTQKTRRAAIPFGRMLVDAEHDRHEDEQYEAAVIPDSFRPLQMIS
ncbi:unnamed protein product [Toxocara canis]|uniref:Reverse transcriptase domain-containing protein n=1 Tax=Toxocara canis TaxID=6265 RepID=A0A183VCR3_TOXCA|nr:unnamed protein product [Toxocara canis]